MNLTLNGKPRAYGILKWKSFFILKKVSIETQKIKFFEIEFENFQLFL